MKPTFCFKAWTAAAAATRLCFILLLGRGIVLQCRYYFQMNRYFVNSV